MSIHTSFTLTTYTNGTGNELTGAVPSSGSPTTQTFDLNGNLLTQQIGGAYTTYTWDYENRLASVALPAGTSVTNTYLPNNRILRLSDISGHLTTLTHDLSGANLIRRDVGGTAPATEHYTQSPKDFGGLLAQYTTASGNSRFYYPDMADNIGLLAKGSATPERHQFQAFGPVYMSSTAPTTQPYGFGGNAGYYTDPISGLQIAWNRVYDANVGQWANRDPIGYEGGDWESIYRYVANNPVRWRDAWGLFTSCGTLPQCHDPILLLDRADCTKTEEAEAETACTTGALHVIECYKVPAGLISGVFGSRVICFECLISCPELLKHGLMYPSPLAAMEAKWKDQNKTFQLRGKTGSKLDYCTKGSHYTFNVTPGNIIQTVLCCPCTTGPDAQTTRCVAT
jgi:RHS repeat-associated protein